jgi:PAS domain S-box-containing protein
LSRTSGRSASRLAAILDALPDALLLVDAAGVVVNANAVALELFEGESAERLLGKQIGALLPGLGRAVATPGSAPAALPAGSSAPPPGTAPNAPLRGPSERLAARRTDGSLFPAEVNTAKLPDDEDELALYVVRDLTGVLDVEAELRRQQRQIELILRAASEGIVGVDNEGRIVLVNPAGARLLRHRASDLGGQDMHELIAHSSVDGTPVPPEKVLLVDSLRNGTKHRSTDEVLWRSDGTSVTVDMTTAPVYEGDVIIGAVMTFEDNSETRAAVRRARELADVLDGELRGPLAAVLTELRAVAEYGIGELGPNVRQALASATTDLAEAAALVDDIVDYQHMVVGDQPFSPRSIRLSEVVDAAVEATDEAAAALGVDLIAHTADVEVTVDPDLFAKMLAHLLADMVTAAPVGGKVVVTAARRGPVARIEIRGPHTGGGPLHLPIARAIVAQHGGTVTTHRIAGKGNTHVVEVPLEGSSGGGRSSATGTSTGRTAIANTSRQVRVAQVVPSSRVRAARGDTGAGSSGQNPTQMQQSQQQQSQSQSQTQLQRGQGQGQGLDRSQELDRSQSQSVGQARGSVQQRQQQQNQSQGQGSAQGQEYGAATQNGQATEQSNAPGAVKQVEKTNGHHTSHGADTRRPLTAATSGGQNGQARIPTQGRTTLPRTPGGFSSLDTKPSKPLPTSDVWTRPQRNPVDPQLDDSSGGLPTAPPPMRGNGTANGNRVGTGSGIGTGTASSGAGVTDPRDQPWQPAQQPEDDFDGDDDDFDEDDYPAQEVADTEPTVPVEPPPMPTRAADEGMQPQPRGRRRAASPDDPVQNNRGRGAVDEPARQVPTRPALRPVPVNPPPRVDLGRGAGQRPTGMGRDLRDDQPTQTMPPLSLPEPRTAEPVQSRMPEPAGARSAGGGPGGAGAGVGSNPVKPPMMVDDDDGPTLLLWPEPDASTLDLLDERGYLAVPLDNFDALPRTLSERVSQGAPRPDAVLVDPIAAPITRRGLRILRGATINAGLPIVVTAGIGGGPSGPQGPDPALLLQALTPPAVSLPRVLLVEARDDLADAMSRSLERQGMQVLHAATDSESISRASDGVPDVVMMDLMQIRRRRTGIVEWLRDHERLTTTPIVVYTALGTDSAQFAAALRNGNAALYLAERSTDGEVASRIGDLLAKICPGM